MFSHKVAEPKQLCGYFEDECQNLKDGICKLDHRVDEEGSKIVTEKFHATSKFNLTSMKLPNKPNTFIEEFM